MPLASLETFPVVERRDVAPHPPEVQRLRILHHSLGLILLLPLSIVICPLDVPFVFRFAGMMTLGMLLEDYLEPAVETIQSWMPPFRMPRPPRIVGQAVRRTFPRRTSR